MKTTHCGFVTFCMFLLLFLPGISQAQLAELKTAPFTAVKWEKEMPVIQVNNTWRTPASIEGTTIADIITFCKKRYGGKWKKRFSEDLVEVMQAMNKPLPPKVRIIWKDDAEPMTLEMTKFNRNKARAYNVEHPLPQLNFEAYITKEEAIKDLEYLEKDH